MHKTSVSFEKKFLLKKRNSLIYGQIEKLQGKTFNE